MERRWGCGIITNINCVSNELLEPGAAECRCQPIIIPYVTMEYLAFCVLLYPSLPSPPRLPAPPSLPSTLFPLPSCLSFSYPIPLLPPLLLSFLFRPHRLTVSPQLYCKVNNVTRSWIAAEYHYQRVIGSDEDRPLLSKVRRHGMETGSKEGRKEERKEDG